MLKRCVPIALLCALALLPSPAIQAEPTFIAPYSSTWPNSFAEFQVWPIKTAGMELSGAGCSWPTTPSGLIEDCDAFWAHLHEGAASAETVTLDLFISDYRQANPTDSITLSYFGVEVQYYVHGVAVSGWIGYPYAFTLSYDDPDLDSLPNGIHDISVDFRYNGINTTAATTTVSSGTSTTVFTVADATNIAVNDYIYVTLTGISGYFQPRRVTAKSGNQLTVHAALFQTPANGDTVKVLTKNHYYPRPIYLHFHRTSNPNGTSTLSPILPRDCQYCFAAGTTDAHFSSLQYVDSATRNIRGWPVRGDVEAWTQTPSAALDLVDLYQEQMAGHTDQFFSEQIWWEEPDGTVDAGLKFVRGIDPKFDEAHYDPGLRVTWFHERLPYRDGQRGIAWVSGYAGGIVDTSGTFWFVEPGGRFAAMDSQGTVTTYAGWVLKPDKDPAYLTKTLSQIRAKMNFKGTWSDGPGDGFHTPLDVAQDPQNSNHFYIVDEGQSIIWKAVVSGGSATLNVFAGSTSGTAGYTNATGTAARFNHPTSAVWDLAGDYLYVADHQNDAIRRISRTGVVTTLFGQGSSDGFIGDAILKDGTGSGYLINNGGGYAGGTTTVAVDTGTGTILVGDRVTFAGVTGYYQVTSALAGGQFSFTPGLAGSVADNAAVSFCSTSLYGSPLPSTNRTCSRFTGTDPDSFRPMVVRMFSNGDLAVMDTGYASIRRYVISTDTASVIAYTANRYLSQNGGGWQWMDVDRWGNSGPQDGIYFGCFQCSSFAGADGISLSSRPNEAYGWVNGNTGVAHHIFGSDDDATPDGHGHFAYTDPPHYYWMSAVDPRGGVIFAGGGEVGLTRLRKQRATDPVAASNSDYRAGELLFERGPYSNPGGGTSYAHKFGYCGFGYLGFASSQDITGSTTDAAIKAMFDISDVIWNDTDKKRQILDYLRTCRGPEQAQGVRRRLRFKAP